MQHTAEGDGGEDHWRELPSTSIGDADTESDPYATMSTGRLLAAAATAMRRLDVQGLQQISLRLQSFLSPAAWLDVSSQAFGLSGLALTQQQLLCCILLLFG